jgi:hypothetical protein
MKSIQQMIEDRGGFAAVQENYIRIENSPFMLLVIEIIGGPYPNGAYEVSVAHYGEQNGDLMKDPEVTFLVSPQGATMAWRPLAYENSYAGSYDVACEVDRDGTLRLKSQNKMRQIAEFVLMWDQNIQEQGFIEAARTAPKAEA